VSDAGVSETSPAGQSRAPVATVLSTALLVAGACWLGAVLDTRVRFPKVGTAILFPAYAIVAWVLLRSPPRRWWAYLLAASLGSFWPHHAAGAPISFVLGAEVANHARVLLAVGGVRRFGRPAGRPGTLREMGLFLLFAGVLGPLCGAFLGAAVVALHAGSPHYWPAWRAWLLSNALTALTLLLATTTSAVAWPRPSWRRALEAAALGLALLAVASNLLVEPALPWGGPVALYATLPLLLWAAVRFGPGGTSAALLAVSALAIGGAVGGRGPFVAASPDDNLIHLQLFLVVMSMPLLLLSALVAEQRRTAEALRASEERYRTVVEDQTELVCRFAPGGALTFANGACWRVLGASAAEVLTHSFWSLVPPDRHQGIGALLRGLTPRQSVAIWEHELRRGPERQWHQWTVRGIFDRQAEIVDYQAVGRDVTEHRLLLAQRNAAEALREADRNKDQFLAMLGHELRNPLAPLSSVVELLRQMPRSEENWRFAREMIERQVGQLTHLVNDLLDLASIRAGKIQLRLDTVDLRAVIAQAVEASRPLISSRQQELTLEVEPAPLAVRGDRARLAQLISNLIDNAAKFTDPGGRITISAGARSDRIRLAVKDTGLGLVPHMWDRVFEPFVQVEGPASRAPGGLGLGLSLVKRLVELHQGTVAVQSDGPGRGSEFIVELPALPLGSLPPLVGPEPPSARPPPLRILLVDDAVDAACALAILLGRQGHRVVVAHDGPSALRAADELDPEVAFLDLLLPGMDGLELAARLRRRSGAVLLVAVTGSGRPEDRRRTAQAGFNHHLVKPIDPKALPALLMEAGPRRPETTETRSM
jgi:PAS domain S-box-containing protein